MDNAVKYSFNKRELQQKGFNYDPMDNRSLGNILVFYSVGVGKVVIKVTNLGTIINEDEKEKIFNRFYRGRNAKYFSPVGSGIGLFLVKKILEVMKGEIDVITEQYKTTFVVTIKQ